MKILKIKINDFKILKDNTEINFIPKSKKTLEDKEYELIELDEGLYVYNTLVLIGKNASGKTTILKLLNSVYDIFSNFRVVDTFDEMLQFKSDISYDIYFYHEGFIYRYRTTLKILDNKFAFENQKIYTRKYNKNVLKTIFDESKYSEIKTMGVLPNDTSILFYLFENFKVRNLFFSSQDDNYNIYYNVYNLLSLKNKSLIKTILNIFDVNIINIELNDRNFFEVTYKDGHKLVMGGLELYNILSSGTTKGLALFSYAICSLQNGTDLIIDEIETHFHLSLVKTIINLYKDKNVNKKGATLIFTTHYPELLDLFNRSDNIYITKNDGKIYLENVYTNYKIRSELLKSKRYNDNVFQNDVDYDSLMKLKEELI